MGMMFDDETLFRELKEAEQELFDLGFDSMSDAVEQAIAMLKAADLTGIKEKMISKKAESA